MNEIAHNNDDKRIPLTIPSPDQYRFAEPDSAYNIVFENYTSVFGNPIVRSATLTKLVERLTYPSYTDIECVKMFMITYRSFCSPSELLTLLIERYCVPTPQLFHKSYVNRQNVGYISIIKVLSIFNLWVTHHYYDFTTDPMLLLRMKEFLEGDHGRIRFMPKQKVWCEKIQEKIKKKQMVYDYVPPSPLVKSPTTIEARSPTQKTKKTLWDRAKPGQIEDYDLTSLHPIEVARQLTLLHFSMYRRIKPPELVGAVFNQNDKNIRSPQLAKFIDHINDLSFWVARCILEAEFLKERTNLLSRILEIMEEFEKLNNFTGLMAFFSSLSLQPVYRLTETKSNLDKKSRDKLGKFMKDLSDAHHKGIVERLHSINPPCVPFFGIYLSKIVFVEAGYSTFVKLNQKIPAEKDTEIYGNPEHISFKKCRRLGKIIREIQMYQEQPYIYNIEPTIRTIRPLYGFRNQQEFEDYLYAQSYKLQPASVHKVTPRKGSNKIRNGKGTSARSGNVKQSRKRKRTRWWHVFWKNK